MCAKIPCVIPSRISPRFPGTVHAETLSSWVPTVCNATACSSRTAFRFLPMPSRGRSRARASSRRPRSRAPSRRTRKMPLVYVPPHARRVLLTWSGIGLVSETAAQSGGYHFYRMNSVYDVDTNVGSTSVPGFAEWGNFYANYRVWRTRVRITGSVYGGSTGSIATVALVPQAYTSTLPTSVETSLVQPFSKKMTISPVNNGGTNIAVLDAVFNIPSVLHITRSQFLNEQNYSANTSSNPATQVYWAAVVQGLGTSSVVTFTYQVYQSMLVEFFNPITVSI